MARKNSATTNSGMLDGTAAAPARARKSPRTRRTATTGQAEVEVTATSAPAQYTAPSADSVSDREAIALLAFSYWEARGCQGGSPEEDWLRAEAEYYTSRASQA